ncbi:MAG: MFS transporter [Bacteroidales bacterium]|nr:MFS transporter [Bacteroidales bacterium]
MGTGFYFLIPTLPVYIVDVLDAGPGMVGYILAAYTLSAMIIRPLIGYSLDAYGRKWIYLFSFLAFSAMLGLYTLAYTFIWLMILRFMHGFAWGAATTSSSTIIVDIVPGKRRGEGIGIYGLSFTLAMAIGPVIALAIMGDGNYNRMFLSSMAIALTGFLLVLLVSFPAYEEPVSQGKLSLSRFIEPRTLPVASIQLLFGIAYGGLMSFITLYARHYEVGQPGIFFTVFAIGIMVSRLVSGRIFDRKGPSLLMLTGLVSGAGGFLVLGLMGSFSGFILAAILVGICMGVVMPTLQTMANNVVESHRRGAANATFITAFDIGIGGGSMVLGLLAELTSLKGMYLVSSGILIIAVILFFTFVLGFYRRNRVVDI